MESLMPLKYGTVLTLLQKYEGFCGLLPDFLV